MRAKAWWLTVVFVAFPSLVSATGGNPDPGAAGDAASAASTAPLDPGIRKMIDTAIAKGDSATVASVLAVARQAAPEAKQEIDERERAWQTQVAAKTAAANEAKRVELRAASPLAHWKGEVEIGASRATGTTTSFGMLGALDLKREGIDWTHKLSARADVQSTNGETTAERIFAAWQPNYRFQERAYAYGLAQYEHDAFAGYDNRYTLGGGLGYRALDGARLKLELEGGPALRGSTKCKAAGIRT